MKKTTYIFIVLFVGACNNETETISTQPGLHETADETRIFNSTIPIASTIPIRDTASISKASEQMHEKPMVKKIKNKNVSVKPFSIPSSFIPRVKTFEINCMVDTVIQINKKGTQLHIPKYAFIDKDGYVILDKVNIQFQEYTNSAEIAFSKIPMIIKKDGKEYGFNSSGMFSVEGTFKGEKMSIAPTKQLSIDYSLAKKNNDIDFYKLDEKTNNWKGIQAIKTKSQQKRMLKLERVNSLNELESFLPGDTRYNKRAGNTFPDIIKGLKIKGFGVYNCDQIYRFIKRVLIHATYQDEEGRKIHSPKVLSLIDLKYNGAFSFDPIAFACDAESESVLMLFSNTGELYMMGKEDFKNMNITTDGSYNFVMKNVSNSIKSSLDLANYLKL